MVCTLLGKIANEQSPIFTSVVVSLLYSWFIV
jgi:hypothetical protein